MGDYGHNITERKDGFKEAVLLDSKESDQIALMDTLTNLITGLGSAGGDKSANTRFMQSRALRFDFQQLTALYRENWIAGSIVDAVPDDMTRAWRRLTDHEIPPDAVKEWETLEDELKLRYYFNFAHKMARLYGGAVLVLDLKDTGDPETPLDWRLLKKGCIRHMKVIDLTRIMPGPQIVTNPLDPRYGQPQIYRFAESGIAIHNSRIIRFDGTEIPFHEYRRNGYWHDTVLNRTYEPLVNTDVLTKSILTLVDEYNIDVHKIKGLMDYLQNPEMTKVLIKRMQLTKQLKATTNMMIIDSEDEVTVQSKQLQGLPSILDRYLVMVTASSDVPAGRILGDSASAFSITHQGMDMKNYYDTIQSKQVIDFNPKLKFIDAIMAIHLGWNDKYNLTFEWNSIFQKTPEEEAKAERARGDVYSLYLNNGVLQKSQVAKDLQNNPYFENIDSAYISQLEQDDKKAHDRLQKTNDLDLEAKELANASAKMASVQETAFTPQKPAPSDKQGMHKGVYDPDKATRDAKDTEGGKKVEKANKEAKSLGVDKKKENKA
jgi:phage-related protein (TIGR01555 family)